MPLSEKDEARLLVQKCIYGGNFIVILGTINGEIYWLDWSDLVEGPCLLWFLFGF
jgi:hypothetical protein